MYNLAFDAVRTAAMNPIVRTAILRVVGKAARDVAIYAGVRGTLNTIWDGAMRDVPETNCRYERWEERAKFYSVRMAKNTAAAATSKTALYIAATSVLQNSRAEFREGSVAFNRLDTAETALHLGVLTGSLARFFKIRREMNRRLDEMATPTTTERPRRGGHGATLFVKVSEKDRDVADDLIVADDLDEAGNISPEASRMDDSERDYEQEFLDKEKEEGVNHDNRVFEAITKQVAHDGKVFNAAYEVLPLAEDKDKDVEKLKVTIDLNLIVGVRPAQKVAYGRSLYRTYVANPGDATEVTRVRKTIEGALNLQERVSVNDMRFIFRGWDAMDFEAKSQLPISSASKASVSV